jgi:hypothetical protein
LSGNPKEALAVFSAIVDPGFIRLLPDSRMVR